MCSIFLILKVFKTRVKIFDAFNGIKQMWKNKLMIITNVFYLVLGIFVKLKCCVF